jgi:transketolase
VETATALRIAIEHRDNPTVLVLTRQAVAHQARTAEQLANIQRGGYVLIDSEGTPDVIVIATGSEVGIAADAVRSLATQGVKLRLVSMPSTNTFERQDAAYRQSVLPDGVTRRVAVEAGVRDAWWRYVGLKGQVVGIDRFGESAPAKELFEHFGFTSGNVVRAIESVLKG